MLATLAGAFNSLASDSTVLTANEQQEVATALEDDAQIMTNTQLNAQLEGRSEQVQAEIVSINTDARHLALQVALLIPVTIALLGFINSFRMARLPEIEPTEEHGTLIVG